MNECVILHIEKAPSWPNSNDVIAINIFLIFFKIRTNFSDSQLGSIPITFFAKTSSLLR
jgi:hypothetical protein